MFCVFLRFLRAPNRALFCLSSCAIIVFFTAFIRAPSRDLCRIPSCNHIVLFSAFLCAPNRALNCATVTGHGKDTNYVCIMYLCNVM